MDKLAATATNRGSYVVICTFDENGTAVTPTSVAWYLYDFLGDIVNGRSAVTETASALVNIVLAGADLTLTGTEEEKRLLTVSAMYNSATYGNNMVIRKTFVFKVEK